MVVPKVLADGRFGRVVLPARAVAARATPAADVNLQNATVNTAMPGAFGAALTRTFTKTSGTSVILTVNGSVQLLSGNVQQIILGLFVGSVAVDVAGLTFPMATSRELISGQVQLDDIPAGEFTVVPYIRAGASGISIVAGYDWISWSILESDGGAS